MTKKKTNAAELLELVRLTEMSQVGKFNSGTNQLVIWVYYEPLMNPSFHLVNKTADYEVVLQIKDLKSIEWVKSKKAKKKGEAPPTRDLRALIKYFKEPNIHTPNISNWEALRLIWLSDNPESTKVPKTMPDYEI